MELINEYGKHNNTYSKKINICKYTEGENISNKIVGVKDICELIIGFNTIEYKSLEKCHRSNFIQSEKIKIASEFIAQENYSNDFNDNLLNHSFQNMNYLSSILYLNEHFKTNCIIYNDTTNKYYTTSFKDYPQLICMYKNDSWFINTSEELDEQNLSSNINEISNIITIDTGLNIFKPYLNPLYKYKLSELEKIGKEKGISLIGQNGKKKLKKELYDDINIHEIKNI